MKRISIYGHYGFGENLLNGQTVKTKIITNELFKQLGNDEVEPVDTRISILSLPIIFIKVALSMISHKNIVMLPAQRGLQFFAPVFLFWNLFFNRRLHYIVIGGWLPEFIKSRNWLAWCLKKFEYIYVETNTMKVMLEEQGFKNLVVLPNCKELKILKEEELVYPKGEPYKLCTFSRVMKEKGIETAIEVVTAVNEEQGRTIYTLDIYGQIDKEYEVSFNELQKSFPNYIKYCGMVNYDKSTDVLKNYFALLFPTYYDGEGFAGTIVDAMAAGVPVIASDWKYNSEILMSGKVGYIFQNITELKYILQNLTEKDSHYIKIKYESINYAQKYIPKNVIPILINNLK